MRVKTICYTLLLSLLIPISLQAQSTGQITGTVTSEGQPLAGVAITVRGTQLRTLSAADGRFSIANVPVGPQVVEATSIGYAPQALPVVVGAGGVVAAIN